MPIDLLVGNDYLKQKYLSDGMKWPFGSDSSSDKIATVNVIFA